MILHVRNADLKLKITTERYEKYNCTPYPSSAYCDGTRVFTFDVEKFGAKTFIYNPTIGSLKNFGGDHWHVIHESTKMNRCISVAFIISIEELTKNELTFVATLRIAGLLA